MPSKRLLDEWVLLQDGCHRTKPAVPISKPPKMALAVPIEKTWAAHGENLRLAEPITLTKTSHFMVKPKPPVETWLEPPIKFLQG